MVKKANIVFYDDEKFTITKYTNGLYKVFDKGKREVVGEFRDLRKAKKLINPPVVESDPLIKKTTEPFTVGIEKKKKKKKP